MKKRLCLLLTVCMLLSLFAGCAEEETTRRRRRSDDDDKEAASAIPEFSMDDLLGQWTAQTDDYEATLVFTESDGTYTATHTVLDYQANVWGEEQFQIKEIENYTLVALMSDGTIEYYSIATGGDTLYFSGISYTSPEKKLGIPAEAAEYAFIRDGKNIPVGKNLFLGMTYEEVVRYYPGSLEELEEASSVDDYQYKTTSYEDPAGYSLYNYGWTNLGFNEDQKLVYVKYHLYASESAAQPVDRLQAQVALEIQEAQEKYGSTFTTRESAYTVNEENRVLNAYLWHLGNVTYEISVTGIDSIDQVYSVSFVYQVGQNPNQ